MWGERGNTLIGVVVGLVLGLAIAVAVALYLTRAPVPFVSRSLRATENVKVGADGKLPDPNQPLYAKPVEPRQPDAKADARTDPKAAPPPPEKGMPPDAAAAETSRYLLQAGAFRSAEDADAMRARLALLGLEARVYPAEQGGTTWYRVRLGPYGQIDDLIRIRKELAENGIDSTIVRVK